MSTFQGEQQNVKKVEERKLVLMFLNGTAMSGQENHAATAGATFLGPVRTEKRYRFVAVNDEFPGVMTASAKNGCAIEGELYAFPTDILNNSLLPTEPKQLELGHVTLESGQEVHSMRLRTNLLGSNDKPVDISAFGGWRPYQKFLAHNAAMTDTLATAATLDTTAT